MGSGSKYYVSLFLCFLKVSRQIFSLDTFVRQADKYITRGVKFFMFFSVFMFAYIMDPLSAFVFYGVFHPCSLEYLDFYDQTIVGIVSLVSLQVLKTLPAFGYCINRKDMSCHESKISFFEYVR